jgi:hypothetical protein
VNFFGIRYWYLEMHLLFETTLQQQRSQAIE